MPARVIRRRRAPPASQAAYTALWRMVSGAVTDAFNCHPDYLTERGRHAAVESVTKRVVGQIAATASQEVRKDGRLGGS